MADVKVNFPRKVVVQDYHTFEIIRQSLKTVGVQCNIHDTGYSKKSVGYVGVIYTGNLNDIENQTFISQLASNCSVR